MTREPRGTGVGTVHVPSFHAHPAARSIYGGEGPPSSGVARGHRTMASDRPRVLIVDDDPMMGTTLRIALEDDYDVEVCPSADAAIKALERERFDVVLCDLMMPRTSGIDLYNLLRDRDPRTASRMLFMTGGAYTDAAARFLRDESRRHVEKPFRVDQLLDAIRAMIVDPA